MKISDGEKLILAMLADIHKRLEIKGGQIDPVFVQETLYSDQLWGFRWKLTGLEFSDEPDPEIVTETVDILDMYRLIGWHFAELSDADKQRVVKELAYYASDLEKFPGFDANHDPHKGVARYLVEQLDRFSDLNGATDNSHGSTSLSQYRRMLRVFLPMRASLGLGGHLTADRIEIFKSGTAPS